MSSATYDLAVLGWMFEGFMMLALVISRLRHDATLR